MYTFEESAVIEGDLASVWSVATDVARWPEWDPHEEAARIDGPFAPGAIGWVKPKGAPAGPFTVTSVDPEAAWSSEAKIPFGRLRGVRRYERTGDGRIRLTERVEVHGPFAPLFRLVWEKGMRRDMPLTFAALEQESRRRASAAR